jgi:hypothetical protein
MTIAPSNFTPPNEGTKALNALRDHFQKAISQQKNLTLNR